MTRVAPFGFLFAVGTALCFLVVIVALGLLVWALVRGSQRSSTAVTPMSPPAVSTTPQQTPQTPQTPLEMLQMRYARGEFTKEQFDQLRRDLGV